ncbi:MAG: hypothetical protein HQM08_03570 [Candidatus Riflebacteria bacterium]|nr:hypothetical protein [Candidatus Riflebacteria bacterium]
MIEIGKKGNEKMGNQLNPANFYKKGSAVLIALVLAFILLIVISSIFTISSYRIQNTIFESQNLKALELAEAGVNCVMTELAQNYSFQTHKLDTALNWQTPQNNSSTLESKSDFNFSIKSSTAGTYSGTLGKGEFKVRCGLIPYKDDPRTLNIDERFCFFRLQALGKVENTIKCVDAIVQRRFPGREFLMYDGDLLSIVFGEPGEKNVNTFSVGRLYGHKGIEIGQIMLKGHSSTDKGSTQEIRNMDLVSAGDGGIYVYSDTNFSFRDDPKKTVVFPKNFDFPLSGTYSSSDAEKNGELPTQISKAPLPSIPESMKKYVRGKPEGATSIPPKPIPFDDYKKQAQNGGIYFPSGDVDYPVPQGWGATKVKATIIDFGNNIHKVSNAPNPNSGVIFSEDNLVIKGNPPKDMKIVSMKNVFVSGDFNQAGNPSEKAEKYGFPQNYSKNALLDNDYNDKTRKILLDDAKSTGFRRHKAVTVISKERLVYDYRSPIDCFENELYPFMKYRLAASLKDENSAKQNILLINGTGNITSNAADEAEVKNRVIASFFGNFPLGDTTEEAALAQKVSDVFKQTSGNFQDSDLEKISQDIWNSFRNKYESKKLDENFGVYKLLDGLRKELGYQQGDSSKLKTDADDDYLFFPEMTTNGMFISCAKRNSTFYAGPDYFKQFDEIGNSDSCKDAGVGISHSKIDGIVHRMFGSEIRYSTTPVQRFTDTIYAPPTRRKIYDETLPSLGLDQNNPSGTGDVSVFVILSWKDYRVSQETYDSF